MSLVKTVAKNLVARLHRLSIIRGDEARSVRAVPVPGGGLTAGTFPGVDYANAYAVAFRPA